MFSLYVSITKDSSYLDLNYYLVNTQFSDEKESTTQLISASSIEELLEGFMNNIEYWSDFNRVVVQTTDQELHNNLMLLTKQKKVSNYSKLLNLHFPNEIARKKYKHCFSKQQLEVLPLEEPVV